MDVDSSSDDSSSDKDSSSSNDMETGIERHVRELENDDARVAAAAVEALGRLADESDNDANCAAIVEAGGIPAFLAFLATNGSAEGQKWAARALRKLASKNTANKVAIVEAGGIEAIVTLVANGSGGDDVLEEATGVLRKLARNATNRAAIFERLVGFLSRGAAARSQYQATFALLGLASNDANRVAIVAAGAVDRQGGLIALIFHADMRLKLVASAVLGALGLDRIASRVETLQAENESLEAENESLQAENESLTSRLEAKCVVCFERAPDVVFMPCFHVVSCRDCGLHEDVSKCPICRVPIEQKHRVYVS